MICSFQLSFLSSLIGRVTLVTITGTIIPVPFLQVKSLQFIWRLGTRRFHLRVPYLQMSCRDMTTWQGTRIVVSNGCQMTCPIECYSYSAQKSLFILCLKKDPPVLQVFSQFQESLLSFGPDHPVVWRNVDTGMHSGTDWSQCLSHRPG